MNTPIIGVFILVANAHKTEINDTLGKSWSRIIAWSFYQVSSLAGFLSLLYHNI